MKQIRVIIIDDERHARRTMRLHLAAHQEIEVVGEAASAKQAFSLIQTEKPDAIFLDIQMPGASGFDLLETLDRTPYVVFVTAYAKYAIRAFEVNALDYLLKPIDPKRLAVAVKRLLAGASSSENREGVVELPLFEGDMVWIKTSHRGYFLPVMNIISIIAADNYSQLVCCNQEKHLVRRTLAEWERILPAERFVMLDRSLIINRLAVDRWVKAGRKMELYMRRCDQPLHLGRTAANRFRTIVIPLIERETER